MRNEEHKIQSAAVEILRNAVLPRYGNPVIFAIPNGGARSVVTGAKLKREGVLAGVPDLFLACSRGQSSGLFIEVKTPKGRATRDQISVMQRLQLQGYTSRVCRSVESIVDAVTTYLEG